jgi:hypothetical protein
LATVTGGTATTTTLIGIPMSPALASLPTGNVMAAGGYFANITDFATVDAAILDDINPIHPIYGPTNGLSVTGMLFVPNRGVLRMRPGDYVFYDPQTGWPILLSGRAAAAAGWVHT